MIISPGAEKAFYKIYYPFMIKTFSRLGTERSYLNIINTIYDKTTANIIINGEILQSFSLNSGKR